jgi:hypothetical protein
MSNESHYDVITIGGRPWRGSRTQLSAPGKWALLLALLGEESVPQRMQVTSPLPFSSLGARCWKRARFFRRHHAAFWSIHIRPDLQEERRNMGFEIRGIAASLAAPGTREEGD